VGGMVQVVTCSTDAVRASAGVSARPVDKVGVTTVDSSDSENTVTLGRPEGDAEATAKRPASHR